MNLLVTLRLQMLVNINIGQTILYLNVLFSFLSVVMHPLCQEIFFCPTICIITLVSFVSFVVSFSRCRLQSRLIFRSLMALSNFSWWQIRISATLIQPQLKKGIFKKGEKVHWYERWSFGGVGWKGPNILGSHVSFLLCTGTYLCI